MEYTNNGITFNNVKDLGKTAGIQSSFRYSASDYNYDSNDNPTAPKFLLNAIDIDWNGAKPGMGEDSTNGITTTGELTKEFYSPMFAKAA